MAENASSRKLHIILGDQLTPDLASLRGYDRANDCVWMAEIEGESRHSWSSKQRTALFLSAMRHFAQELEQLGLMLEYRKLDDFPTASSIGEALKQTLSGGNYRKVVLTQPGEFRVLKEIEDACFESATELTVIEDDSFLVSRDEFAQYAQGRKQLRMEFFYREMRKRHDILMEGSQPAGGKWNFDTSNRKSFGKSGPRTLRPRLRFEPDETTREVIDLVETRFANHPGSLSNFAWPTNRYEALRALNDFIEFELPQFGAHQDAMWTGEPFLNHSLLASSINLKLLTPIEVIRAAEDAYNIGHAAIESVEGFIRQILGWREYVRGIYWLFMPEYLERNALSANEPLPDFYWTGDTEMNCIKETVTQTMRYGYAHHIQRLMVTGLYSLLLGVDPKLVHQWYLSVYVDAVEWVELPNTLGMSQYADGGIMASKPYVATGKYIKRMSNYCANCQFDPDQRTGKQACPFTTLYWDFLDRNKTLLEGNPRMRMQLRNLKRIAPHEMSAIRETAEKIRHSNHTESSKNKYAVSSLS